METQRKSKCTSCSKRFVFRKFMTHKCQLPASNSTLHNKEDLKCTFCGLQTANPKLLEIHMISCMHRNIPQMCKLCRNPIRLRSHGKQYCANCSTGKEGNEEYGLRFKVATLTESPTSKSSRPFTAPTKNIENRNLSSVNCTNDESSLISARQRMALMSDSQKQGKRKKFANHPVKKKQTKIDSPKVTSDKEANAEKQSPAGLHQLRELHHLPGKVSKSSERQTLQQKKYSRGTNVEVASEKIKNNNSQKLNPKTSRQVEQKTRQASKKNDATNKKVTIQLLLDAIPENDCGMLLHSASANKMDHYYKCCRCGKSFKSIKLGSSHLLNCKSNKLLSTEVSVNDVKWVCTICHSFFATSLKLTNHVKGCNILKKKYDRACERRCEKCNFRCLSSLKFEEHDCTKELKCMKACAVRLNVVKMNSAGRIVMYECEFCSEILDEQFTGQHFESHHPGQPISGNCKQYYVNLNSECHKPSIDTTVVKTEPSSPDHKNISNGSYNFKDPLVSNYPSFNHGVHNFAMPPPPPVRLPIVQSTVSLPLHQSSSTLGGPSSSHTVSNGARAINQQICSCVNRNVGNDTKPCLKCLSKLGIASFPPNCKVVPFRLAKIMKENSEDSEVSNSNLHGDPLTEIGSGMVENLFPFQFLDSFQRFHALTPPSSHNGISPPSTPLVQSLANGDPCSPSDVCIGSLNDAIAMVPDIAQIDEPRCPDELVQYINDDNSPNISLEQCDDQELFVPIDSCTLTHMWDAENLETVDTWAVVPSRSDETIEKYICAECMAFSCLDKNVIIKHLYKNHQQKLHFLAMFIKKHFEDS